MESNYIALRSSSARPGDKSTGVHLNSRDSYGHQAGLPFRPSPPLKEQPNDEHTYAAKDPLPPVHAAILPFLHGWLMVHAVSFSERIGYADFSETSLPLSGRIADERQSIAT